MTARGIAAASFVTIAAFAAAARAGDASMPPWSDANDIPLPSWARSVAPTRVDAAFYAEPGKLAMRRGSAQVGARLPLFGARRAPGCMGRWLEVGPLAWICSDVAELSGDDPVSPALGTKPWILPDTVFDASRPPRPGAQPLPSVEPTSAKDDGLPYRYFFAGRDGAYGYANLATALDDSPDQDLEPGFAVAIVEERVAFGEAWGKTRKGRWVAMRELVPARTFLFHGELVKDAKLDFGWVTAEKANVYDSEKAEKGVGVRVRFERVAVREQKTGPRGAVVRVSDDGEPARWMRARDLALPSVAAPPGEIAVERGERWIDVDLVQQTVVAYEGERPVFSTVVSTGKGPPGTPTATPKGTHRIWVKIFTSKMDNLDDEDAERHYAIEDVPWVQFFDHAVALHGAFWHHDFGHAHSHGCVNLAPLDARWLFAFTGPHLPAAWTAAFPTKLEPGTLIRVR